jgi:RND family efflux transporter MFP subunit
MIFMGGRRGFGDNSAMNTVHKLILTFFSAWLVCLAPGFTASAQEPQDALVTVDPVIRQSFSRTVPILGRLVARRSGTVASRVSGAVSEVDVQVGDRVTRGQRIALIDAEPQRLQKQLAENQRREAEARIATARAQLDLASQEVQRLSTLKSSAAISQAAIDDANQQQNIAFARVREAEAAVSSADAQIRLAELELGYARITAPFDGTVTEKLTELGSYLQRGQAVVHLVSDRSLELEADIPAVRLGAIAPGLVVDISFEDGSRHQATVRAVVPEENPRTRTRRVRFTLGPDLATRALAVEQSVTVLVPAGESREIRSVHKDGVIRRGPESIVYVVVEGQAQPRPIRLGDPVGNRLEVLEGLEEGERVVIRGNERLQPGQPVAVAGDPS